MPDGAEDDPEINGSLRLLRRVPELLVHNGVIEKGAFYERAAEYGLSVTVWETPGDLEDVLREHDEFGVVCVNAETLRAEDAIIVRKPLDGNLNHCEVFPRFGGGALKRIRRGSRWVRYPEWVLVEHRTPEEEF